MSLEELRNKINKKVKGVHCEILSNSEITKNNGTVSTPSYDLNRIISGDLYEGLPNKSLTYLVGEEASFKSSFSAICAANSQKEGYTPVIIDAEGAWNSEFVKRWGLDPDNILYVYSPFVDEVCAVIGQLLDSDGEKYFLILDSLGALENEKLLNDSIAGNVKADQGGLQKRLKRAIKLTLALIKKKNSIGVYTGHMYGNSGAGLFGPSELIGGGKFASLAPDIIIKLQKTKKQDKEKNVIGNIVKAQTLKNRFYPAFNKCEVDIDYINGINKYHGMFQLAEEFGFIEKRGAGWCTNLLTEEKVQGEDNTMEWFTKDMLDKINSLIKEKGYSTIDEELKEIYDPETGEVKVE